MKIISSADWHVNLHKKKVPQAWQVHRYELFFEKLHKLEDQCDIHVISGDLFDTHPRTDDTALLFSYLNAVTIPTIVIPGNHEATSKGHSFWEHFKRDNVITNSLVHIITDNSRIEILGQGFQAFPYGSVQTDKLPVAVPGDILVTHIRGEVPPHITAEYDFDKLRPWKLILLGDLHFNHKYSSYPAYYPGSPVNTSFDRTDKNSYGVDIINFNSIDDYTVEFIDLALPKLLRRSVKAGESMKPDPYHHVVYEVTGSIDELAKVEKTELLDKKLVQTSSTEATLDLSNKSIHEELELWLKHTGFSDVEQVLQQYKELGIT
jgi:DNA repair exonuclease SbcCD nuclease subunit